MDDRGHNRMMNSSTRGLFSCLEAIQNQLSVEQMARDRGSSERADEVQYVKNTTRSFHDPQRVVKSVLMMNASLGRCKDAAEDSISEFGLALAERSTTTVSPSLHN